MLKRLIIASQKTIASAGSNVYTVKIAPKGYIKAIHITEHTDIATSAGSYVANACMKQFIVRRNGKQILNIDGMSVVDDVQCAGPKLLRELLRQASRLNVTNEYWTIPFDPPLPPGEVELTVKYQSATRMGSDATITAGDHDIEVEYADPKIASKIARTPYIFSFMWADATKTGNRYHYFPKIPDGMRLRILAFCTHDSGTYSSTTYDALIVEEKGNKIWSGKLSALREENLGKSGLALNAGCFIMTFGSKGLKIVQGTTLFKFQAGTAGTLKYIEMLAICY